MGGLIVKILAVDDDSSVLELLDLVLGVHGYSVQTKQNGEQAIAAFIAEPFDLVLTDIDMPGLNGNELIRFLKSSAPHVPVVAISGEEENASKLFDRVLVKPFYTRELISLVESFFTEKVISSIHANDGIDVNYHL